MIQLLRSEKLDALLGPEAATSSGVLLPSTRAFGHVPLTGEVLSNQKERILVPHEHNKDTADHLLSLENRFDTLLGEVFRLDQWLESVDGQHSEMQVRRVERQREEALDQLRSIHTQLEALRKELE